MKRAFSTVTIISTCLLFSCGRQQNTSANTEKVMNELVETMGKKESPSFVLEDNGQFGIDFELVQLVYDDVKQVSDINKEINSIKSDESKWFQANIITNPETNKSIQLKTKRLSQLYQSWYAIVLDMYSGRKIVSNASDSDYKRGFILSLKGNPKLIDTIHLLTKYSDYYAKQSLLFEFTLGKATAVNEKLQFNNAEIKSQYLKFANELVSIESELTLLQTKLNPQ